LNIDILYHLSYDGQCLPAKINIAIFIHVLLLLAIALSVLRFTDSDYPFGIFKLFLKPFLWNRSILKRSDLVCRIGYTFGMLLGYRYYKAPEIIIKSTNFGFLKSVQSWLSVPTSWNNGSEPNSSICIKSFLKEII
jgi:hypothetical protein